MNTLINLKFLLKKIFFEIIILINQKFLGFFYSHYGPSFNLIVDPSNRIYHSAVSIKLSEVTAQTYVEPIKSFKTWMSLT